MNAYLLGALVFIIGIVVFILQNDSQVSVLFVNWRSTQVSLAVVVIISACVGALIAFLLDSFRAFKSGQKLRKLTNANQKYEQEIQVLKAKLAAAPSPSREGEPVVNRPPLEQGE